MIDRTSCLAIVAVALLLVVGGAVEAALNTPAGVTASSSYSDAPVGNLINNPGLSVNTSSGTHDNQSLSTTMWMSNGGTVANEWLVFDLGQSYDLSQAYIRQMNQGHAVNVGGARNTRTVDIYVSPDDVTYTQVGGTRTLELASETFSLIPTTDTFETRELVYATSAFGPELGQAIRLQLIDSSGGGTIPQAGIDNITLTASSAAAVPESSTFALAALGLLGLGWYGRRRKRHG